LDFYIIYACDANDLVILYTFKHLEYYFYQMNGGGVSLSCVIGGSYTTNPPYI